MPSLCPVSVPEWMLHIILASKASLEDLLAPGSCGTILPDPFSTVGLTWGSFTPWGHLAIVWQFWVVITEVQEGEE